MSSDDVNAAKTSVLMVDGDLLAPWEGSSPFAMDAATLETRGPKTLRDDLKGMPFLDKPGGRSEADAWLVGTVPNTRSQRTEVHILDAADVSAGRVATFAARYAWPLGFYVIFAPE